VLEYATVTYPEADPLDRRFESIIGNSAALESVLDQVEQVASTDSTVLIEGETGTGKELIAHAIHSSSQRYGRAFIKLNCAVLSSECLPDPVACTKRASGRHSRACHAFREDV
jgi:transcriptional regulator with GAF, ATPase, and Fis domain